MKTAKAAIEAISVSCPECDEVWSGTKNGSTLITPDDGLVGGHVAECLACGAYFKFPAIINKLNS